MGEVIRKSAAAEDIVADGNHSFVNAQARGGMYKTAADQALKPALALSGTIGQKRELLAAKLAPLVAAHRSTDDRADGFVGRVSDMVWNDVGRPAPGSDGIYDIIFPAGITFYTDGPDDEQPERMILLAELLESGIHPQLDPAKAKDYGKQLRDEAAQLDAAVEALRKPRLQLAMYDRMVLAAAKNVHAGLTRFKRLLRAHNISEADIHTVIPDRPQSAKKAPPSPNPGPGFTHSAS